MKILIVEDHRDSAEALCRLLTRRMASVECCIAGSLSEALATTCNFEADITLLDLNLPGSSVMEVIRSIEKFHPPVIVVTDMDDPDIILDCFKHRAQNVMTKAALHSKINSIQEEIEADKLIRAITDAHLRCVAPNL